MQQHKWLEILSFPKIPQGAYSKSCADKPIVTEEARRIKTFFLIKQYFL